MRPCVKCGEPESTLLRNHPDIPRCSKHRGYYIRRVCEVCGTAVYLYRKSSFASVCQKCINAKRTRPPTPEEISTPPARLEYVDVKEGKFDLREWMEFAKTYSEQKKKMDISQEVATVKIDTDKPVSVCWSSDWHLGSSAVDYHAFDANMRYLLEQPDLYMGVVGDTIENIVKFRNMLPVGQQIMNKGEQHEFLSAILDEVLHKMVCYSWGNHDIEFDERTIGVSFVREILKQKKRIPFFNGKGLLRLQVGDQTYTHLIMHYGRFNSTLHPLHSAKRGYELDYPADVVVTAHTHQPAHEEAFRYDMARRAGDDFGGPVIFIRCGTYKTGSSDMYSNRLFGLGILGIPTVVYYPDKKKAVPFRVAEDAVKFAKAL